MCSSDLPLVLPGVKALWTYSETGFHALAGAVVRESYSREALATAWRILGEGQLTLTKFLLLTDAQLDLGDFGNFLENVLARFEPEKDLVIFANTSMDTLDYTGSSLNHGSKAVMMGLGAVRRELPRRFRLGEGERLPEIKRMELFCAGCLLLEAPAFSDSPELAAALIPRLQREPFAGWPLLVLVDDLDLALETGGFLWQVFTRFDPAQDIYAHMEMSKHRLVYHGPILIDARMKPAYPGEVVPDGETVKMVDRRWKEYGIG